MISDNIKLYNNYYSIQTKCYCCNIHNHISIECPMVHIVLNKDRIIRNNTFSEPNDRMPFIRKTRIFKVLSNLQKLIIATLKIHRTTTFELYNLPDEDEDDEDEDDEDEEMPKSSKFQRTSKYIGRKNSNKERTVKSKFISIIAPLRKSKSYTRNFEMNSFSNNVSKFNTNSVIYEERDEEKKGFINRSKDTFHTEIKLLAPENMLASSNRTSLISPGTFNPTSNPNVFSYFSINGTNMSTIEKKQETYCISDAGAYFDTISPSKTSYNDPISQNDLANENFSEDLESCQSSLIPQKSKASKKSEIIYSTIVSQNQKSSNSLTVSPSINNTNNPSGTNVGRTYTVTSKKDEKKKEMNNSVNTTVFLQNNYFQIISKAREEFDNNFEKMKIFDVYFPQNNVTVILEDYRKIQVRNRKTFKNKRCSSINSHASPYNRNLSNIIKNLPIFKKNFATTTDDKTQHGTAQNDGNYRKRMMSEASFVERSKTIKSTKNEKGIKSKLKCKFWMCSCCKKGKMESKKKPLPVDKMSRRVSVAERLRRASVYV